MISEIIFWILHGVFTFRLDMAWMHTLESPSMHMDSNGSCIERKVAHLRALTSACRGRLVFVHLVQANTNSPLQSLATAEMMDLDFPTAASTLSFNDPLQGTIHWALVLGGDDVDVLVLTPLNPANALESRALMSSWLSSIPSNDIPFLSFHTWSHIIAPNCRISSPFIPIYGSDGGFNKNLTKSVMLLKLKSSSLIPNWQQNHRAFVSGHLVKMCSADSFSELHNRHSSSGSLENFPIFSFVGRQSAAILQRLS